MRVLHEQAGYASVESAFDRLQAFLARRRLSTEAVDEMEGFERELHEYFVAAEREVLAEELARLDVDLPAVTVEGELYRRVVRCEETYVSAAGPVQVMRSLYRRGRGEERTLCPLELRAGIVEGRWTPLAARQVAFVVAHLTPQEGEDLFQELGNMTPSKSSLDRLPKQLSARWEAKRSHYEAELRAKAQMPTEAVTLAVSLDGVMVPMKDGARAQKREESQAQDKRTCGPAGYSEVGCGTLTYYDAEGNRLSTVRMARMPERHKAGLKTMLTQEIEAALRQRPDLGLVKLADGARDNWTYLRATLPPGVELIDFYHVCEHRAGERRHSRKNGIGEAPVSRRAGSARPLEVVEHRQRAEEERDSVTSQRALRTRRNILRHHKHHRPEKRCR